MIDEVTVDNRYKWANKLREDYQKGQLSQEEIERWDNLGFVWDTEEALHRSMFFSLSEFMILMLMTMLAVFYI